MTGVQTCALPISSNRIESNWCGPHAFDSCSSFEVAITRLLSNRIRTFDGCSFEVHSIEELEWAMAMGPKIVGVNCRNLKTLEVDPGVFSQIIPKIPNEIIKIAESGISNRAEVADLETLGVNGILVGETLVRSSNPGAAIAELIGR